jgi:hypothetical protein
MGAIFVKAVADLLELPVMRDGKDVSRDTGVNGRTRLPSGQIISMEPVRGISNPKRRRMRTLQSDRNVMQRDPQVVQSDRYVMQSGFAVTQRSRKVIQRRFTVMQSDLKVLQRGRNVIQSRVAVIQRVLTVIQSDWECQLCQSHLQHCQSQVLQSRGAVVQKGAAFKIECFSAQGERIGKKGT